MASQPIYQFYAELCDYEPKMWRRFQIANNITMARLGYILMTMFEMQANHLFCFNVPVSENFQKCVGEHIKNETNGKVIDLFDEKSELKNIRIELLDEDGFSNFPGYVLDAAETKVKNVLDHESEEMLFSYDYGDDWMVSLTLEKIFEDKALSGKDLPRIIEGAGYGILEDCGGTVALEEIAKAFKMKKGTQYKGYCEWLGTEDLNLAAFDLGDMNFRLKKVPRIYAELYEYGLEPTKRSIDLLTRRYQKT